MGRTPRSTPVLFQRRTSVYEEQCDVDYWNRLSAADKKWLSQFVNEYYAASGLKGRDALHRRKDQKRSIYSRHNAAKREIYLQRNSQIFVDTASTVSPQDALIEAIDLKRRHERIQRRLNKKD